MSFPRYPEYKDSGIEWLGEVPVHWVLKRLGQFFEERREKASDTEFAPLSVTKKGIVPRLETAAKTQDGENRKRVCAGDFVINSRSDRKGSAGVSPTDGTVSLICIVLESKGIVPSFVHHLLRSVAFQEEFYRYGKGIVADLWSTGYSEMKNILLAVPPSEEQAAIADFLDHETALIDSLIEEQQRLIELLKEKRQAMISHAVTKGLDSQTPMKDSGVEWLGNVPKNWTVGKLKWYLSTTSGGTPPSSQQEKYYGGDIPWMRTLDLNNKEITECEIFITEEALKKTSCRKVPKGAVLVAMYGGDGTIGKNGLLTFEAAINQAICAFLPSQQFLVKFLHRYMQFYRPYWMIGAESSRKDPNIGQDRIGDHYCLIPPLCEQKDIIEYLDSELDRLKRLQAEAEKLIQALHERRAALIVAAVTGKIDVRGCQPPPGSSAPIEATATEPA